MVIGKKEGNGGAAERALELDFALGFVVVCEAGEAVLVAAGGLHDVLFLHNADRASEGVSEYVGGAGVAYYSPYWIRLGFGRSGPASARSSLAQQVRQARSMQKARARVSPKIPSVRLPIPATKSIYQ